MSGSCITSSSLQTLIIFIVSVILDTDSKYILHTKRATLTNKVTIFLMRGMLEEISNKFKNFYTLPCPPSSSAFIYSVSYLKNMGTNL